LRHLNIEVAGTRKSSETNGEFLRKARRKNQKANPH
jgi:hypothetical protein